MNIYKKETNGFCIYAKRLDCKFSVYPVPQKATYVSAWMNGQIEPGGQHPKATDVSLWYGVYPIRKGVWSVLFNWGKILLLCTLFYVSSCASAPPGVVQPPKTGYVIASWYGSKFHGRQTASGEIYNMYSMTCAHKNFPFGTRLRVTYLRTNKSAIVTVNDRGPFIPGRDLDLSYAAAKAIGLSEAGVGRVRIQHLGRNMRYVKRIGPVSSVSSVGPFTIQVGSFREKANADHLKEGLRIRYDSVYITTTYLNGRKYYRVRIGPFTDKARAYSFAKTLAEEGYSIFITIKN